MSFYQMHRGWMDNPLFKEEPYTKAQAWEWMIGEAHWRDAVVPVLGNPVMIKRGSFAASIRFMAEKFKWTKKKVECFLFTLKKFQMCGTDNGTGQLIITICKYEEYQLNGDTKGDTKGDSRGTAGGQQGDKQEEIQELQEGQEEKKEKKEGTCLEEAVSDWNEAAGRAGLPTCQRLTSARKAKLRARLLECGGRSGWKAALEKLESSAFLTGRSGKPWKASFDFMLQESSFTKLMEGVYDDHKPTPGKGSGDYFSGLVSVVSDVMKKQGSQHATDF